jgi:transcriptional regulator with XRE-family HTH domain
MTIEQALNEMIQSLADRQRWSQRQLASRLGVSQPLLSKMLNETRRQQALDFYERLAAVFGMPLSVLIAEAEARVVKQHKRRSRHSRGSRE